MSALPTAGIVNYVLSTLAGIDDQRPEIEIRTHLSAKGIERVDRAKTTSSRELGRHLLAHPTTVGDLFTTGLVTDQLRELFTSMQQAPTGGFDRPIRVVHSLSDSAVPVPLSWAQLAQLRTEGVDVEYQQLVTERAQSLAASMPGSLEFAARVMS